MIQYDYYSHDTRLKIVIFSAKSKSARGRLSFPNSPSISKLLVIFLKHILDAVKSLSKDRDISRMLEKDTQFLSELFSARINTFVMFFKIL